MIRVTAFGPARRVMLVATGTLILCTHAPAWAKTDDDGQLWLGAEASGTISGPLSVGLEALLRFGADADGLYEGEYRVGLDLDAGDGRSLSASYLRIPTYSRQGVVRTEDRLRQEISATLGRIAGGEASARLRLEQRFVSSGSDTGHRLRPALSWSMPVRTGSPTTIELSHESFINLNGTDWGQDGGYDRMRNFAGLSTPLGRSAELEIGYLNQYSFRSAEPDSQDHVLSVAVSYEF